MLHEMRPYRHDIGFIANGLRVADYPWELREHPRPRLIWLRAFHRIYNPALAPQVLARLLKVQPDARLTMIGPDKQDGSLQHVLRDAEILGVSGRLTIVKGVRKEEVPSYLQQGDIFLNTTNVESFGLSVAEAMACGLCVVSTNAGALPYWLTNERDALLVSRDNVEAMTDAVIRLLKEDDLARRLSLNARRKVEEFDWSRVLPKWEELLCSVAQQRMVRT
ncbi:MAG: glycosyltransferase family 4 protein [Acidobacteriales bacterium]|nr:glycosyltransferase family 4 protein [Terriglobales bacterium]